MVSAAIWIAIMAIFLFLSFIKACVYAVKDGQADRAKQAYEARRDAFCSAVTDERLEERITLQADKMTSQERADYVRRFVGGPNAPWESLYIPDKVKEELCAYPDACGAYVIAAMASEGKLPKYALSGMSCFNRGRLIDEKDEIIRMMDRYARAVQDALNRKNPGLNAEIVINSLHILGEPLATYSLDAFWRTHTLESVRNSSIMYKWANTQSIKIVRS